MVAAYIIESIHFGEKEIFIKVSGRTIQLLISKVFKKLEAATDLQRGFYTISPSGYGIQWPLIDEDLSIAGLLNEA